MKINFTPSCLLQLSYHIDAIDFLRWQSFALEIGSFQMLFPLKPYIINKIQQIS